MRLTSLLAGTALTVTLALTFSTRALALPAEHSAADIATVHDYTLTSSFLDKWEAISKDPNAPACTLMTLNLHGDSLSEAISEYDARPGNHNYLASHGLTSRDMILGTSALAAAAMQEMQAKHPEFVKGNAARLVSPQNMAFYQGHKDEIHSLMQKVGKARLSQNGGKLPDCAK